MRYAALFLILILASPVSAVELTILTEEYPPFNYSQEGKITGVSTEVVQHVMAATGYEYTIKSLPWSEAYEKAQKEKNTLIYSISRRKKREPLLKWIGVLTPTTYSVKALSSRNDVKIDKLTDMKKYKIGTNADDAVETWLLGKGFALSDLTRTTGSNSVVKNFRRLMNLQAADEQGDRRMAGARCGGLLYRPTARSQQSRGGTEHLLSPDRAIRWLLYRRQPRHIGDDHFQRR
jgi:hypothetical protein